MREYDLEEILAEYAEKSLETAQPEEESVLPEEELTEPAAQLPDEEEAARPEENEADIHDTYDAGPAEEDEEDSDAQLTRVFKAPKPEETESRRENREAGNRRETAPRQKEKKEPKNKRPKKPKKESFGKKLGFGMLSLIFMVISLGVLAWTLQNVHPDTTKTTESARSLGNTNLVSRLDTGLNNAKANALSDIAYIPKHYTIPEGETVAPRPQEANFGSVTPENAANVMDVIQLARDSGLLEGQDVIFNPNLNFEPNTNIQYYYDETILTIIWKELIDGNTVTCCEVKVADASQFRRKLVDDTFGSPRKLFATSIAASVNSVVAMNADFYMFRDFGIVVYDRELYRFSEDTYTGMYKKYNCTDTMFVTEEGDFIFWHRLQEASPDQMRAFIEENNILFSIAFGPILVENGSLTPCDWYPAGEIDRGYSRAGIGQKDHLHYFYMSLNHSAQREARWTVNTFGERMYERGLQQAYCLDGGQTSEIVWRGAPFNYIDFGGEREVSDIMYFATAIPESGGTP